MSDDTPTPENDGDDNDRNYNEPIDEPVGYGKPPKHTQFKKGKSGNPKGRPAGQKNFATYLAEMLTSKVSVTENGKVRKKTTIEVGLSRLREKSLKGDPRSLEKLLDYAERYGAEQAAKDEERQLTQAEDSILKAFEARIRREAKQEALPDDDPSKAVDPQARSASEQETPDSESGKPEAGT